MDWQKLILANWFDQLLQAGAFEKWLKKNSGQRGGEGEKGKVELSCRSSA